MLFKLQMNLKNTKGVTIGGQGRATVVCGRTTAVGEKECLRFFIRSADGDGKRSDLCVVTYIAPCYIYLCTLLLTVPSSSLVACRLVRVSEPCQ